MIENLRHWIGLSEGRACARAPGLLTRFVRWRKRRKALELMSSLPDYLLKDIGLSRGELEKASSEGLEVFSSSSRKMQRRAHPPQDMRSHGHPRAEASRQAINRRIRGANEGESDAYPAQVVGR